MGIEPMIFGMKARRPRPLDDGAGFGFVIIHLLVNLRKACYNLSHN